MSEDTISENIVPRTSESKKKEPKNIVIFADGTGNSAAKLFKTNVWRMYQAVAVSQPPPDGQPRQIAYYHDGVGTSAYKPLALLGGVFGVGLMRNVIDIYKFVCRNYVPGDNLYLFGFSRGAFTVRILASLIAHEGVLRCATEEELNRSAPDVYRRYRRSFKLPLWFGATKQQYDYAQASKTVGLVDWLRNLRDLAITAGRRIARGRRPPSPREETIAVDEIAFIGVWDTVSAYGLPFEELTRAIDDWVWPLSMPNYRLSEKVRCARHALALDEERDSFQPLLWDETWEKKLAKKGLIREGRLQQVWFAGVHSNVGGGYPNDGLAHVPLQWMMQEAGAEGLWFKPCEEWGWTLQADPFGKRYNSRSGIAGYYRPQTRRLLAKLQNPPDDTLILRDPRIKPPPLLDVTVHESVLTRIRSGTDRYAPIILPPSFQVAGQDGALPREQPSAMQVKAEEFVFDDVWRRRVVYFASVLAALTLLAFPLIGWLWPPGSCEGIHCVVGSLVTMAGGILPGFLNRWIASFAAAPGLLLVVVAAILALQAYGATLRVRIEDGMREIWALSYGLPLGPGRPATLAGQAAQAKTAASGSEPPAPGLVRRVRTARLYQRTLQRIKWEWVPDVVGVAFLLMIWAGLMYGVARSRVVLHEAFGGDRAFVEAGTRAPAPARDVFETRVPTWPLGREVEAGKRYRMTMTIVERWKDKTIRASPLGSLQQDVPFKLSLALPWRRVLSEPWFKPILRIEQGRGRVHLQALDFRGDCPDPFACGVPGQVFVAEFAAGRGGRASLFVNDVVITPALVPWVWSLTGSYYENNRGSARIDLAPLEK